MKTNFLLENEENNSSLIIVKDIEDSDYGIFFEDKN